jgi:hypothetical protein
LSCVRIFFNEEVEHVFKEVQGIRRKTREEISRVNKIVDREFFFFGVGVREGAEGPHGEPVGGEAWMVVRGAGRRKEGWIDGKRKESWFEEDRRKEKEGKREKEGRGREGDRRKEGGFRGEEDRGEEGREEGEEERGRRREG